jgi:hypothetical protein
VPREPETAKRKWEGADMSKDQHESQSEQAQSNEAQRAGRPSGVAANAAEMRDRAEKGSLHGKPITQMIDVNMLTRLVAGRGKPMKEGKEGKEKPEKYESKEGKEKPEKYESKEKPEKYESKEGKDGKEWEGLKQKGEKELAEKLGAFEGPADIARPGPIHGHVRRVRRLKAEEGWLSHFIKASLRPDLSQGALRRELDVHGAQGTERTSDASS